MSDSRKIRAKRNILVSLGSQIVVLLCGIVVPRAMLGAFGSEAYGATASIAQFLSYITLLEGGIGGVARAALYGPISRKDYGTISEILSEVKRFFNLIACIFVVYVLIIACSFQSLSDIACMDWISTFFLVIVISISSFGQYFIGITFAIFLQADQKLYITNGISTIATIINALITVLLIHANCSILVVKLVSSCIFFMRPVALWIYVKRNYPVHIHQPKRNHTYLAQKWSGLGQHIAYYLHSNTDIVVLTVLTDLRTVAVYSVYHMIVSHMQSLAVAFISGMESIFGDMLAKKEYTQLHRTFHTYDMIISLVAVTLFSTTAVLILPFVKIYTADIKDTNYLVPVFAMLQVLSSLCYCLRSPYHSMIIAAGHFKQTRLAAYGEAVMNIGLSILLVYKYGLVGVVIGTLAATALRYVYYFLYLPKNILQLSIQSSLKRILINCVAFFLSYQAGSHILACLHATNYLQWSLCGMIILPTIALITLFVNCILEKNTCSLLFKNLRK